MVGHLNAHGRLAGDGCFHTHVRHRKVQGDIVCQRGDAADLDTRHGLHLVPGDGGAPGDIQHTGAHAKAFQRIHQLLGVGFQLFLRAGVGLVLRFFKQLNGRILVLISIHRFGLVHRGRCRGLLGSGRLFHCRCHQRADILFLHRFAGNADPAVLVGCAAHGNGVFGAHPGGCRRDCGLDGHGGHLRRDCRCRAFRLGRRHCRGHDRSIKAFRCRRLHRLCSLCKEIGCIGLHRVLYDGLRGRSGGRAQRVLPKGAARAHDERLDGLAAALLHLSVIGAKVYVKGSPGPGYPYLHRRDGRGGRLRLGKRLAGSICGWPRLLRLHLFGHLVAPVADAVQPVRHTDAESRSFHLLFGIFLIPVFIFCFVVVFLSLGFCRAGSGTFSAAGCALLRHGRTLCVHAAKRSAQPLPHLCRGQIKNVQADTQCQHDHDKGCRGPSAQQQQAAAQQCAQRTAADPCIHTVCVAGSRHLEC